MDEREADGRVAWWLGQLRLPPDARSPDVVQRLAPIAALKSVYVELLGPAQPGVEVEILEVFSGPLASLGNALSSRRLTLTQLDPAAEAFAAELDRLGLASRGRLVRGRPADVPALWPRPRFDLIVCQNAKWLEDPVAELRALYTCLRPNGSIHLTDRYGEEISARRWRLGLDDHRLFVETRDGRLSVEELIADGAVRTSVHPDTIDPVHGWANIIISKPSGRRDGYRRELEDFETTAAYLEKRLGAQVEEADYAFVADFFARKPDRTAGSILPNDAMFLLAHLKAIRPRNVLEIGVSSGVSSAFFLECSRYLADEASGYEGFDVAAIDLLDVVYADRVSKVGWVVEAMTPELVGRYKLFTGVTSFDLARMLADGRVTAPGLVFLDAEHAHPWPLVDMTNLSRALKEGTPVLLHDIALAERAMADEHRRGVGVDWKLRGVQWLYEYWPGEKARGAGALANVGAVLTLPKAGLAQAHAAIIDMPWERPLTPEAAELVDGFRSAGGSTD